MVSLRPYLIGAGLLYLVGTPFALDSERRTIDDQVRSGVPGRFARLSDGRTRYDLLGPQPAQVIVLVHGFTSPAYVWGSLPERLQAAGYRTLIYDLYGRGYSDRPVAEYDMDLYQRQLEELLEKVEVREKFHLVGLSMGALIASEFALRHPDAAASLTLVDPAGFAVDIPLQARVLSIPLLGDYLVRAFGDSVLLAGNARGVHDQSLVPALQAKFAPQLEYRGYKRAILSSMRNMPLSDFRGRYRDLAGLPLPVEIFWGRQDQVTPFAGTDIAAQILPQATIHAIDGAGHLSHYEKPELVTAGLLEFVAAHPAPQQGSATQGTCSAGHVHVDGDPSHAVLASTAEGKAAMSAERARKERVRIGKEEAEPAGEPSNGRERRKTSAEARAGEPAVQGEGGKTSGEKRAGEPAVEGEGGKNAGDGESGKPDAMEKPKKECRECDPRRPGRGPTDAERARRRALSQPNSE